MESARALHPFRVIPRLLDAGLLLALPLVFHRGFAEQFSYPKTFLAKLLVVFAAMFWAAGALWGKHRWPRHFRLGAPLALLALAVLLSCLNSPVPMFSLEEAEYFLCGLVWIFLLAGRGGGEARVRALAALASVAGAVVAAIAIAQWAGFDPLLFGGYEVEWGNQVARMRVYSTLGNPNFVGGYLIGAVFPATALALTASTRRAAAPAWAAVAVMSLAILGAGSRGAWLGLAAGVVVFGWLGKVRGKRGDEAPRAAEKRESGPIAPFVIFPAFVWLALGPFEEILVAWMGRLEGRVFLWRAGWPMVAAHPLLGSGWGTLQLRFLDLQAQFLAEHPKDVIYWTNLRQLHNDPLQVLLETGLLGFAAFAWLLWRFARGVQEESAAAEQQTARLWLQASAGGVAAILVDSVFNFQFAVPPTFLLLSTFLAVPSLLASGEPRGEGETETPQAGGAEREAGRLLAAKAVAVLVIFLLGGALLLSVFRRAEAERRYFTGRQLERAGNVAAAEDSFRKGLSLHPSNGRLHFALARVLYLEARYPEALEEALAAGRTFRDSHLEVLIARIEDRMGLREQALASYRHALALDPTLKTVQGDIERLQR